MCAAGVIPSAATTDADCLPLDYCPLGGETDGVWPQDTVDATATCNPVPFCARHATTHVLIQTSIENGEEPCQEKPWCAEG